LAQRHACIMMLSCHDAIVKWRIVSVENCVATRYETTPIPSREIAALAMTPRVLQ
jgi:hypothetical protein